MREKEFPNEYVEIAGNRKRGKTLRHKFTCDTLWYLSMNYFLSLPFSLSIYPLSQEIDAISCNFWKLCRLTKEHSITKFDMCNITDRIYYTVSSGMRLLILVPS